MILALHIHVKGFDEIVFVDTIGDAVVAWSKYRDANDIASSDMCRDCGQVRDDHGKLVAVISYNGKVWPV